MKLALFSIVLISLITISGCSKRQSVIIDPQGIDMDQYQRDLAECKQITEQVESDVGEGAVGGALVGGLVGAVVGGPRSAVRTAGVGAVLGGAKGAGATKRERDQVLKNCLRNRGYNVLN